MPNLVNFTALQALKSCFSVNLVTVRACLRARRCKLRCS
jgi:hypothetical protein